MTDFESNMMLKLFWQKTETVTQQKEREREAYTEIR